VIEWYDARGARLAGEPRASGVYFWRRTLSGEVLESGEAVRVGGRWVAWSIT